MDTTVKIFDSTMANGPVVSRTAGTLIAMLDACLVDGFGLQSVTSIVVASNVATVTCATTHSATVNSVVTIAGATPSALNGQWKVASVATNSYTFVTTGISDQTATGAITTKMSPAGWTKVFSGTNKAVYRSPNVTSTQTYIRIDDSNAEYARPVGYLTMTDIDTGTGAFGASWFNRAHYASGTRKWWVAANDTFVHFGIDTNLSTQGYAIYAFGDINPRRSGDPYRFIISGSGNPATNWGYTTPSMSTLLTSNDYVAGTGIARSYTQIGGGVNFFVATAFATPSSTAPGSGTSTSVVQFPNGGDNSIILADGWIYESASKCLRGKVPGAYFSPQPIQGTLPHDYEIKDMPDVPGKTLLWKLAGSSNAGYGGYAIDVTGPWS